LGAASVIPENAPASIKNLGRIAAITP